MEKSHHILDHILGKFRPVIGNDFQRYRNHVYRVYLNCLMMDTNDSNEAKYAIAAVFHDIGIWTADSFDYLAPSIQAVKQYLEELNRGEWFHEIAAMINWHHKLSSYQGEHALTVETFRKADWIDVSFGWKAFGYDRNKIKQTFTAFPTLGFHLFLVKKASQYFLKRPLHPLPMFKR